MIRLLSSLAAGLIFGFGLILSGMTDPARVRGFLDVAGAWDPTLVFVLAGAVIVTFAGYRLIGRTVPPPSFKLDPPLLLGAALFGIGWGLVGLCPGPAIVDLGSGSFFILVFVAAMAAGMALFTALPQKGKSS